MGHYYRQRKTMERKHFLYMMISDAKAPGAGGDTLSWFRYYKWEADVGEVFVPMVDEQELSAGDLLWFIMDGEIWGYVTILRVDRACSGTQELWYDSAQITRAIRPFSIMPSEENVAWMLDGCLPEERGARWMERMKQMNASAAE